MVRKVRGAVLTAALAVSTVALTPGAAFADAAHHPGKHPAKHVNKVSVTFNCDHCTIYGDVYSAGKDNIVGNGNGNGSENGNGNGNVLLSHERGKPGHEMPGHEMSGQEMAGGEMPGIGLPRIGLPGIGFPAPEGSFVITVDGTVFPGLDRVSQEGDVQPFFPYPPFLRASFNVVLPRVFTKAVYSSAGDQGHVTITTDAQRITCAADGNLHCDKPGTSQPFDPIKISQY